MQNKISIPFLFRSTQIINRPLSEIFPFFSQAENLQKLTPAWLNFKILTSPPIELKEGTLIDYQLRLMGIPVKWRTEITVWEPPHRFVDEQISGPYKLWHHEHYFEEKNGMTEMRDTVKYDINGLFLRNVIKHLFVELQIKKIFKYRSEIIDKLFNSPDNKVIANSEKTSF